MQNNLHGRKGLGWGGDWFIVEHKWHYWGSGNRVSSWDVNWIHAKFLYTYMQIRERGTIYLWTHLVHAHLSLLLTPPAHHSSTSPEYLSDPLFSPSFLLLLSDQGWFPPKEQVVYVGANSRKHSEEGMGREGGKPWRLNQRAGHNGGSALLGTLWGGIRMCLCLSLGGKLGIYLLTPILPWLRVLLGCSSSGGPYPGCPVHGRSSPPDTGEPLSGEAEGSRAWGGSGHCTGDHPAQVPVSPELVQGSWGRISRASATAIISPLEDHLSLPHSPAISHVPLIHPLRLSEGLPTGNSAGEDY